MADLTINDVQQAKDHTSGWDWENSHVSQSYTAADQSKDVSVYDIVESGTVLIAAGPADLTGATQQGATRIVPIGLVETATVAMSKPLSRIFEIGSKLSYIISGRTVGEIALARVLFDGPSLLKVLYQGEVASDQQMNTGEKQVIFRSNPSGRSIKTAPIGSGNIAMNLASSFFDQPIGLAFFFRDRENQAVSTVYFEGCRVSTWNIGIAANMNVLTESIRMEFIQCTPIVVGRGTTSRLRTSNGELFDTPIIGSEQ